MASLRAEDWLLLHLPDKPTHTKDILSICAGTFANSTITVTLLQMRAARLVARRRRGMYCLTALGVARKLLLTHPAQPGGRGSDCVMRQT